MPGTDCRADSSRMKEFQAAIIGRGSMVEMMVSSMSETRPNSMSSAITCTSACAVRDVVLRTSTVRQPGCRPWLRTRWSM